MKSVLISIQPKHCKNICTVIGEENGKPIYKKTVEVRKTRPLIETPFKCYIYCTKNNSERLLHIMKDGEDNYGEIYHGKPIFIKGEDGSVMDMHGKRQKVIGEFVCDRIYGLHSVIHGVYALDLNEKNVQENLVTCLTVGEAYDYGKGKPLCGWHISDLKIYDTPKELKEFKKPCPFTSEDCEEFCKYAELRIHTAGDDELIEVVGCHNRFTTAPQSWGYVEEL